ncbi:hypothetical protein QAD02_021389 [Eretmocerus hayati]|uniref:Uncharacterized protein n=1 Tax=Eretmocerus hayati TaxID=131215 RepID=A0ACC2PQ13_9HYME|nr:hypothetical protein QAD02_021389 [Eretmocerus hayati]
MEVDQPLSAEICVICEKAIDTGPGAKPSRTLQEKAVTKLRESSVARRDKRMQKSLKNVTNITVHDSCRSNYSRLPSNSRKSHQTVEKSKPDPISTRSTKKDDFPFTEKCFICGCDAGSDFELKQKKLELHKQRRVSRVTRNATRQSLLDICQQRKDYESDTVFERINNVPDLVKVDARYHSDCFPKFCNYFSHDQKGRPLHPYVDDLTQFIIRSILEDNDDCQFSMRELIQRSGQDDVTDFRHVQERLRRYFHDSVVFTNIRNDVIITYIDKSKQILSDSWFRKRCNDEAAEREKIVKKAADIILDDIRGKVYDTGTYKAPSNFLEDIHTDVPHTLKIFLDTVMIGKKKQSKKWDAQVCTVSHMIISAARPRTFISSLQLGLSSVIHKQHASRKLIDNLSFIGICASYTETMLFEASLVKDPESLQLTQAFIQFAFDNADHNTQTLDGSNTFHVMGGIMIVTPHSSVTSLKQVTRLKKIPKAVELAGSGVMELQKYSSPISQGMDNVIMKILGYNETTTPLALFKPRDFTWLCGKSLRPKDTKGYNSFMEMVRECEDFQISRILSLPIINNPPSELDTVYTALLYADQRARAINQRHVPVTFDHPLWMKSEFILENQDPNKPEDEKLRCFGVIGMFHLLMSTSKAISSTMDGSGLREIFALLFAENSLDSIFAGKAHDRAMRGHKLVMVSIATLILREVQFSEAELATIDNVLKNLENPDFDVISAMNSEVLRSMTEKFLIACEDLRKRSPTAELWIQYFSFGILLFKIVESYKRGDWNLLMETLQHTLPLFHATAHLNYAKATHLFLQKMLSLEEIMDPMEYDLYTRKQYFTVRRRNIVCSGNPPDLTIEQVFMRTMKVAGGLTHGRGVSEGVIARWIMSMIVLTEVTYAVEFFCSHGYAGSEQFSDDREASIKRDAQDLVKITDYMNSHNPFDITDTQLVVSISTGLCGDSRVNCHQVLKVGHSLLTGTFNKKYKDIHLKRKSKIISIAAAQSSIPVENDTVVIDPTLLFQRLSMIIENKDDMKEHLKLELAPYPKALFDQHGMSKTQKHKFIENFTPTIGAPQFPGMKYIIDGGFLLHKVVWHQGDIIDAILQRFVKYIEKHYSQGSTVIFDGYPSIPDARHIKSLERARRVKQNQAREAQSERGMPMPLSKDKYLSNEKNKNRLIQLLIEDLRAAGHTCEQADEDADTLIVNSAIRMSREMNVPAIIVGEDIDLLVILTQLADEDDLVYFFKPGKGKTPSKYFSSRSFHPEHLTNLVAFFHAFCGCDTVSSIFGKGKNAIVKLFQNKPELVPLATPFNQENASVDTLVKNGTKIMARLYDPQGETDDLDEMRYKYFKSKTTKLSFKLETLPPTRKATKQHILRTFLQIQLWHGNSTITAKDFGWFEYMTPTGVRCLKPVYVEDNIMIPPTLMQQIFCGCETGCSKKICKCVRLGVPCTDLCKNCHGTDCQNVPYFNLEVPTDDLNVDQDTVEILNDSQLHDESTQVAIQSEEQSTSTDYRRRDESTSTDE